MPIEIKSKERLVVTNEPIRPRHSGPKNSPTRLIRTPRAPIITTIHPNAPAKLLAICSASTMALGGPAIFYICDSAYISFPGAVGTFYRLVQELAGEIT